MATFCITNLRVAWLAHFAPVKFNKKMVPVAWVAHATLICSSSDMAGWLLSFDRGSLIGARIFFVPWGSGSLIDEIKWPGWCLSRRRSRGWCTFQRRKGWWRLCWLCGRDGSHPSSHGHPDCHKLWSNCTSFYPLCPPLCTESPCWSCSSPQHHSMPSMSP